MPNLLEEKDAIRELLSTYCFCSDRGDLEAFLKLFTPDCVWDGGPWGRFHGPEALGAFFTAALAGGKPNFRHFTTNETISVAGESAVVRSYVLVMSMKTNPPTAFFTGFYEDHLVKVGGRWLFKSRVMQSR